MKMQPTSVFVFTILIAIGLYDFAAVYFFPQAPSISQHFQAMQTRAPFVMIVLAICVGHLCFPTRRSADGK